MNMYVVRHGQTDWNKENILLGSTNRPLNQTGIEQAYKLKEKLKDVKFDHIISSSLERAAKTANIVSNNGKIITNDNLKERDYGKLEGTKPKNIAYYWDIKINSEEHSVENLKKFLTRIFIEMDQIIKKYQKDENILIVTHYGVVMAIEAYFNEKFNYCFDNFLIDNCEYRRYKI